MADNERDDMMLKAIEMTEKAGLDRIKAANKEVELNKVTDEERVTINNIVNDVFNQFLADSENCDRAAVYYSVALKEIDGLLAFYLAEKLYENYLNHE